MDKNKKKSNEEHNDFIHCRYKVLTRFIYTFLNQKKNCLWRRLPKRV